VFDGGGRHGWVAEALAELRRKAWGKDAPADECGKGAQDEAGKGEGEQDTRTSQCRGGRRSGAAGGHDGYGGRGPIDGYAQFEARPCCADGRHVTPGPGDGPVRPPLRARARLAPLPCADPIR